MASTSTTQPWGRLVKVTGVAWDETELTGDLLVVGRSNECGVKLPPSNELASSEHCQLRRDGNKVLLKDVSLNGTVINLCVRLQKGDETELISGDVIWPTFSRQHTHKCSAFRIELTAHPTSRTRPKRTATVGPDSRRLMHQAVAAGEEVIDLSDSPDMPPPRARARLAPAGRDGAVSTSVTINASTSSSTGTSSSAVHSSLILDDDDDLPDLSSKVPPPPATSELLVPPPPAGVMSADAFDDELRCAICQDLMHDPVSVVPCLHGYCAGCLSVWSKTNNTCPNCRVRVQMIQPNRALRSMIDRVILMNPSKARNPEEIAELDRVNTITKAKVPVARGRGAPRSRAARARGRGRGAPS